MSRLAAPAQPDLRELLEPVPRALPLVVVAILLLSTAADVLPGDSLIGIGAVQLNLARLLILLGLVAIAWVEGWSRSRELFRTRLGLPLLLLLLAGLVASHHWGTYPRYRFLVEGVAAFYLTFAVMRVRADATATLVAAGAIALAITALTAVAQVSQGQLTGFYRHGCTPVTRTAGSPPAGSITRAIGTFANPNVLAGYLMLVLPVGGLAALTLRRVRGVAMAVAITLGFGYLAVLFTYSRAAVLLSIAVLGVGAVVARLTHRRYLIAVAIVLAVAVSFLVGSCGSDATAGYGRGEEWRQTLEVIRHNLVYGVGLGRLGAVLHARNALSTAQHAHNLFLTWWAEAGLGALVAWVWLAAGLIWRSLRAARAGVATARAGLLAMLGFFGYSMIDHPANVDRVALAFWIVAGIAAASALPAARAEPEPVVEAPAPADGDGRAEREPPPPPPPEPAAPAREEPERVPGFSPEPSPFDF